jgi:glycosyltransferase involved in cell wall biosynthesis
VKKSVYSRDSVSPAIRKRPIKILRMIARLNIGGPAIHVQLLTEGMDRKIFDSILVIGIVSPSEGDMSYLLAEKAIHPIIIPELQREIRPLKDFIALIKTIALLKKWQPDIIHTHTAKAGTIGRMAAIIFNFFLKKKIRIVHTFHGNIFEGYFSRLKTRVFLTIERFLAGKTDWIIAISEKQKEELSVKYCVAPNRKINTVKLGLNLEPFLSNSPLSKPLRRRFAIGKETFIISIIGRLAPIKNHKMFLDAAKLLLTQNREKSIEFFIVGDGESRKLLEEYSEEIGIARHVYFCGWMKDVSSIYSDIDVLALTSTNEGTPVSIIEAMASSVPVISTDVGGVRDLMGAQISFQEDGKFRVCERGILCEKQDPRALSMGLSYLMKLDPHQKEGLIERARSFVEKQYSQARLIRDMSDLYIELIQTA